MRQNDMFWTTWALFLDSNTVTSLAETTVGSDTVICLDSSSVQSSYNKSASLCASSDTSENGLQ